ncbi:hypothetical protein ACMHYB_38445 [Sorangium sp. So ce1128]
MIAKMSLRSEDLVNQTALTLPEREMMDMFTFSPTIGDQTNVAVVKDSEDVQINQSNLAEIDCWQLAFALVNYSDYSEAEAEEAYQDCMIEKDVDQDNEDDDDKKDY